MYRSALTLHVQLETPLIVECVVRRGHMFECWRRCVLLAEELEEVAVEVPQKR